MEETDIGPATCMTDLPNRQSVEPMASLPITHELYSIRQSAAAAHRGKRLAQITPISVFDASRSELCVCKAWILCRGHQRQELIPVLRYFAFFWS